MQDLGTLGGTNSSAAGINARGEVTGTSDTECGSSHAFLWTPSGGMQDLGTLGGKNSSAAGIDARGEVTGTSDTAHGGSDAFLWSPPGHMNTRRVTRWHEPTRASAGTDCIDLGG